MSGNWFRASVIGLSLLLFFPAVARAQGEARSTTATLDTVVVTASRTEEKLKEVTSSVTVVTEEMIKKSSVSDMSELLRQQGFQVEGFPAGGQALTLRGMKQKGLGNDLNSAVLILLNGRRFGGPTLDFIGLANVERIEIIRGPAAVQYGPAGMGGVVNIITKRGGEKTEIRAEAGAGSNDMERLKLAASGQAGDGRMDFAFGAGQQYQGDIKTGNGWTREGSRLGNKNGFNGDLGVNLQEGHRLGLNFNYFGVFGVESPDGEVPYDNKTAKPPYTGFTSHDMKNSNVALSYEGATEDQAWNWLGRFSFGHLNDLSGDLGSQAPNSFTIENDSKIKNLTATLGYDQGGLFALTGGLDYIHYNISNRSVGSYDICYPPWGCFTGSYDDYVPSTYSDLGTFLSGKLRFLEDSLILSAGARLDAYKVSQENAQSNGVPDPEADVSQKKSHFSPSVGLAFLPADWLKLRTNYSQGFRMPTAGELNGADNTGQHQGRNLDLKPEESKTWEIGADAQWEFISTGLTYFRSKWNDKIAADPALSPQDITRNINIKGATIAGYELALSADLGQAFKRDFTLRPYVNLTYLSTRRNEDPENVKAHDDDDTLDNVAKTSLSYGLDFVEPHIDLTANVNASYAGTRLTRDWTGTAPKSWVEHTPGTIVDMSLEKGLLDFADKGKLKARAEVNNLMDKYHEGYLNYADPGRSFYVGLVYSY